MISTFVFLCFALPPEPTLLESLDSLAKEIHANETNLISLEKQKRSFELELANLRTKSANNQIELIQIETRLKKRIRSLAQMPTGARIAILGGVQSLQDYLRTQHVLRFIARHDRKLQKKHSQTEQVLSALQRKIRSHEEALQKTIDSIQEKRETILAKRNRKLQFLQDILDNRTQSNQLALEFIRIHQQLDKTIGTLTPGPVNSHSIQEHIGALPWPTLGKLISSFGQKVETKSGTITTQNGITLQAPYGNQVFAVFDGTVVHTGWLAGYGEIIIIDHGRGYHSIVGHLRSTEVQVGKKVTQLAPIGTVGDSGSTAGTQLYFELRHDGKSIDPMVWLRKP